MSTCPKVVNYSFDSERVAGEMKGSKTLIWAGIVISKTARHHGSAWVALKARTKQCFKVSLKVTPRCWFSTYLSCALVYMSSEFARSGVFTITLHFITGNCSQVHLSRNDILWAKNIKIISYCAYLITKFRYGTFLANSSNSCNQEHWLTKCMIFDSCLIAEFCALWKTLKEFCKSV